MVQMSERLIKMLLINPAIYGYYWTPQCGNWTVIVVKKSEVYCVPEQ